jgi:hypothetical protein
MISCTAVGTRRRPPAAYRPDGVTARRATAGDGSNDPLGCKTRGEDTDAGGMPATPTRGASSVVTKPTTASRQTPERLDTRLRENDAISTMAHSRLTSSVEKRAPVGATVLRHPDPGVIRRRARRPRRRRPRCLRIARWVRRKGDSWFRQVAMGRSPRRVRSSVSGRPASVWARWDQLRIVGVAQDRFGGAPLHRNLSRLADARPVPCAPSSARVMVSTASATTSARICGTSSGSARNAAWCTPPRRRAPASRTR